MSFFATRLLHWYKKNNRDLPWRRSRDPYAIWISEVMLQQTTVKAVIPYYEKWLNAFPNVSAVARSPLQKILRTWQGLGYYARARNIHKAAKMIMNRYGGQIPCEYATLRELPGFGPYTTGAVLSIAFDQRRPIIDANVRRVVMRQLGMRGFAVPAIDLRIEKFLLKIMPQKNNNIFNQALMEIGALICRPVDPECENCPVAKSCLARKKNIQHLIPKPRTQKIQTIQVAVGIIEKQGKYFIQKRPAKGLLAGLWEFPGGKIDSGETPRQALERELDEELGIQLLNCTHFCKAQHFYTQFKVQLDVWRCQIKNRLTATSTRRWETLNALKKFPMPAGSVKILEKLKHRASSIEHRVSRIEHRESSIE